MNEYTALLNLSVGVAGLILCLLGALLVITGPRIDKRTGRYFILSFLILFLYDAANILGQIMRGRPGVVWQTALILSNFTEFLMPAGLTYVVSAYLLSMIDRERKRKALRITFRLLLVMHIVLLLINQMNGMIYTIDESNVYHRSVGFPLSFLPTAVMLMMDITLLIRNGQKLTKSARNVLWICFSLPFAATIVQLFVYGVYLTLFSTIISALVMYLFILSDQTRRYYAQIAENKQLQVDIMLSQIRPHFLFNSLGAIQALCRVDPEAAESATKLFARYLRGNLEALSQNRLIPFSRELQHVGCYLELEQLRFGDALQVCYDLKFTDFLIPSLTLQALVENAVRHGIRGTETGTGTVRISSENYGDRIEVVVSDNGRGFDPEEKIEDGHIHIGLENVRYRLKAVAGGKLLIRSEKGKGTEAVIVLPKEREAS